MADFLLELRSEEIPARMQDKARDDLARLFSAELVKAGLKAESLITYATPRRLALIAKDLPAETLAVSEETKGPKTGAPPQALEGFLRKTGLTQDQLVERDGVYFAVVDKPGRATPDVLAEAIPAIIRAFPWPKSQRWGAASFTTESLRWVRPLQGIVALFGDDVVECEIDGIVSGRETVGHRFMGQSHSAVRPEPVEGLSSSADIELQGSASTGSARTVIVGSAANYSAQLRACHVIVDQDERRAIIRDGAAKCAADAGLVLVEDEGLVNENSGLTEWPVPMLGRFDPAFLAVPEEVIQLTARVNQKYFVCQSPSRLREGLGEGPSASDAARPDAGPPPAPPASGRGVLANAFVCTANIVANDGGAAIVAGNEKVLAARLSDAKFFWEQDLKVRLEDQAKKLSQIVFHEKLGTVADKVERVAKLARWLCEEGIITSPLPFRGGAGGGECPPLPLVASGAHKPHPNPSPEGEGLSLAALAERAARLCKADLVTGMVGEFPELQGVMGGYYARAQGEPDEVADAIRDHYKPVGQGDDVPTAPVTVAVSLADKLDTLVGFFAIHERPTGSKDPFALRRAAVGALAHIIQNDLRFSLRDLTVEAIFALDQSTKINIDGPEFRKAIAAIEKLAPEVSDFERFSIEVDIQQAITSKESGSEAEDIVVAKFDVTYPTLLAFFADRLKVQQREAGVRHDLIDAVFALGGEDDLVRLLARVKALQSFITTPDGANLLAGYKRATRVIPAKAGIHEHEVSGTSAHSESAVTLDSRLRRNDEVEVETALREALDTAEPLAQAAIEAEDFEGAMAALSTLRAPIDAFFEGVMVNDPDPDKRAFRMGLLTRFRDAVHRVADFGKIEG